MAADRFGNEGALRGAMQTRDPALCDRRVGRQSHIQRQIWPSRARFAAEFESPKRPVCRYLARRRGGEGFEPSTRLGDVWRFSRFHDGLALSDVPAQRALGPADQLLLSRERRSLKPLAWTSQRV